MRREPGDENLRRARNVGGTTAMTLAGLTSLASAVSAAVEGASELALTIGVVGIGLAPFAFAAGRIAGARTATRDQPARVLAGILGGLACLVPIAVMAAAAGTVWSQSDPDPDVVREYVVRPFLAILCWGAMPSVVLGAIAGLVFHLRMNRWRSR